MSEIVSMETKLVEKYEAQLSEGLRLVSDAQYHLGRVATIYSAQMDFDKYAQDLISEG